ncbi:MAG: hypothetical protein KBC96_15420 [Armatimonadetes bacterium]|nr:hypothetical protein [Armatimonadota bacterium]
MKQNGLIRTIEIRDRTGRVVGTKEVVTYPGLLSKAHEEGLIRVRTRLLQIPSEENGRTAIAKAAVETAKGCFEAIGDANPENVNSFIVPHLIRMAETRAKARALRDAVNVGIVSFEELDGEGVASNGSDLGSGAPSPAPRPQVRPALRTEHPKGNGGNAPMTEAQRRYLFRLLASRGLSNDEAHAYLKERFEVASLASVTKDQATRAIDELLKEVPDGAAQR